MSDSDSTLLAEALRDRYVLERELGRGGMAPVWLARDLRHDRLVAPTGRRPHSLSLRTPAYMNPEHVTAEPRLAGAAIKTVWRAAPSKMSGWPTFDPAERR